MTTDVPSSFHSEKLVPNLIKSAPQNFLSVEYNGKKIEFGQVLTPTFVKDNPKVFWDADDSDYYTLCVTDPDARPNLDVSPFQVGHWLVTNIPGNNIEKGETLIEYVGSGAPKGTGYHRYIFLLFKQSAKLHFDEKHVSTRTQKGRVNFNIQKFVDKYELGTPVAGNMFQAEYDDYVPIVWARYTE